MCAKLTIPHWCLALDVSPEFKCVHMNIIFDDSNVIPQRTVNELKAATFGALIIQNHRLKPHPT